MSAAVRWVVRPGDAPSVAEALTKLGEIAAGAAADGRAFVNGRRAAPGDALAIGDEIVVWSARSEASDVEVRIVERWDDIVVAYKPPSLPTTPDRRGARSLVLELAKLLADAEEMRGHLSTTSFLEERDLPHAASRLDVGVSGVVLCALGRKGQKHIEAMRSEGLLRRTYVAIATGFIEGSGTWDAPIGRVNTRGGRSRPALRGHDFEPAATRFRALSWAGPCSRTASSGSTTPTRSSLLLVEPVTGRMHQIRVHAAGADAPLLGDREHGGPRSLIDANGRVHAVDRIGLHALAVELPGLRGELLHATAPVPADLRYFWKTLDGPSEAWNELDELRLKGESG